MKRSDSLQTSICMKRDLPPTAPLPAVLQTLACRFWPLAYFERCHARYGDPFTVHPIDMPPLVFISNPQEVHAIFKAPADVLHTGAGGDVVAPLFGEESFMLGEMEEHTYVRNLLRPTFRRQAASEHAEMVAEIVDSEIASWPLDRPFAVYPHLRALTLRVIVRSLFGGDDATLVELRERLLDMLAVMASFLLQEPRLRHLPGWRGAWRRFERQRSEVHRLLFALIERRRACDSGGGLLETLLGSHDRDGTPMSDRQVRDNLMSVLIAGHETTASELAWAFQLLAHNPAVQRQLIEEIDADSGEEYLAATIHEVLRRRPVFPFAVPRAVAQPIEIGGWTYHPPTRLLACIYLVHHNPTLYPEPQLFDPGRFLGSPPWPSVWVPWGGGRKRCLGQHLALLEMRTVLRATLAERLVLPASAKIERARWRSVLITPHAGSRVVLRARRRTRRPSIRRPAIAVA